MRIIHRKKGKENQERKKARKKERKTERKTDRQTDREREREGERALESHVWLYMDFQPPGFVNAAPGAGKIVPRAVAALRWVDQGCQPLQQHYIWSAYIYIYIHTYIYTHRYVD